MKIGVAIGGKNAVANATYLDHLLLFSCGVFENATKWTFMSPSFDVHSQRYDVLDLYEKVNFFPIRGHSFFRDVPDTVWYGGLSVKETILIMRDRIRTLRKFFNNKIIEWEVLPEMLHSKVFNKLGHKSKIFQIAHEEWPEAQLYLNEWAPFTERFLYRDHIKDLLDHGAKISGIGLQAHLQRCVSYDVFMETIDILSVFDLPIKISEFTMQGNDEILQAEETEKFLTMCKNSNAIDSFYVWGFWEGCIWNRNMALWREDFSIKPNGTVLLKFL